MTKFYLEMAYEGIDFDDEELIEKLMLDVPTVDWGTFEGEVRAYAIIEAPNAVVAARAVTSAVRRATPHARVTRVVEDLVSVADIADRVPHSRQHVLMLAKGERGPGTFPAPRATVGNNQKIWDWAPVKAWFEAEYGFDLDDYRPLTRDEVTDVERMLHRTQSDDLVAGVDIPVQTRPARAEGHDFVAAGPVASEGPDAKMMAA